MKNHGPKREIIFKEQYCSLGFDKTFRLQDFRDCNFSFITIGRTIKNCIFTKCSFDSTVLYQISNTVFKGITFDHVSFCGDLRDVTFIGCDFIEVDFPREMNGVRLLNCIVVGSVINTSMIDEISIEGSKTRERVLYGHGTRVHALLEEEYSIDSKRVPSDNKEYEIDGVSYLYSKHLQYIETEIVKVS